MMYRFRLCHRSQKPRKPSNAGIVMCRDLSTHAIAGKIACTPFYHNLLPTVNVGFYVFKILMMLAIATFACVNWTIIAHGAENALVC
jgi:hypothetical protein